jgi:hypothetical protein
MRMRGLPLSIFTSRPIGFHGRQMYRFNRPAFVRTFGPPKGSK